MQLDKVITKEDKQMRLPWWGVLLVIAGAAAAYSLFDHFGEAAIARPTLYSAAVITITIAMRWKLREHLWFWVTTAFLTALHVPLILLVPWTDKWIPALVVIPVGILDSYAMLWVISVVAKSKGEPIAPAGKHPRSRAAN